MKPTIGGSWKHTNKHIQNFGYDSPFVTLEDGFNTSDFNQYDANPSGKILKVQSNAPLKLKRGNIIEEVMGE